MLKCANDKPNQNERSMDIQRMLCVTRLMAQSLKNKQKQIITRLKENALSHKYDIDIGPPIYHAATHSNLFIRNMHIFAVI